MALFWDIVVLGALDLILWWPSWIFGSHFEKKDTISEFENNMLSYHCAKFVNPKTTIQ